jgi:DNA transformation protein
MKQGKKSGRLNPMRVSAGFRAMVLDHLAEIGDVTPRAMFGGVGLYCDGLFFGIIARDVLYLKVDEGNRSDFLRAECAPFQPYTDRPATMQYYAVPLAVVESPLELSAWARKAVAVARRAQGRSSR